MTEQQYQLYSQIQDAKAKAQGEEWRLPCSGTQATRLRQFIKICDAFLDQLFVQIGRDRAA